MAGLRLSTVLLSAMVACFATAVTLVKAVSIPAAATYSCGVDNAPADKCSRTTSKNPIDCVDHVPPGGGAVVKKCVERKKPQSTSMVEREQVISPATDNSTAQN